MDLKEKQGRDFERQIYFIKLLFQRFYEDYENNKTIEPFYSYDFIANKTQMKNDIKRLRRELMKLYRNLERR